MAYLLPRPITEKETNSYVSGEYYIVTCTMQGYRATVEDYITAYINAPEDQNCLFAAIYDGHGGHAVAKYCSERLHSTIMRTIGWRTGDIKEAIEQGYQSLDGRMRRDPTINGVATGSTAVTVMIKHHTLYCANVGDSFAVACVSNRPYPLTVEHKPNNAIELSRITKADHSVAHDRVDGRLAVSRAFGNWKYKNNLKLPASKQAVTSVPYMTERKVDSSLKFVLLGSDGVSGAITPRAAVKFVQQKIEEGMVPESIAEALLDKCVRSHDNASIVLIIFKRNINSKYLPKLSCPYNTKH